jgi:hypothetical protein
MLAGEANSDDDRRQNQQQQSAVTSMCGSIAWGQICPSAFVAKGLIGGSRAMLASLMGGGRHSEYGHWPTPRTEVRRHGKSCVPRTDDGDAFGCRILPWKRLSIGSLSPLCSALFLGVMP